MKLMINVPYPCQGLCAPDFLLRLLLDPQVRRRPHQRVLGRHRRTLRRRVSEDDDESDVDTIVTSKTRLKMNWTWSGVF